MVNKLGDYEVRVGNAAINFWPLPPGTTVAAATPAPTAPVAPGTPNTVAVPPAFGIFDIVIGTSQDPHVTTSIAAPVIPPTITATPTTSTMPLIPDAAGLTQISFAVPVTGASFTGKLRLTARRGSTAPGTLVTVDLPLGITAGALAADMFVFFVLHAHPPRDYIWVKQRVVDQASATTFIDGASGRFKLLRDNGTFTAPNREFPFTTDATGFVCRTGTPRNVLGLATGWPFIISATHTGHVPRGHLLKPAAQATNTNLAPLAATPDIRMIQTTNASLATKRIIVDAGHGVVYDHTARRSQEWYVAHQLGDAVIARLTAAPFNVPAANIFRTRTAGFGMIEPGHIAAANAPEAGDTRFEFDLVNRKVRARVNAVSLKVISDLLLTRHDTTTNAALPVAAADRATVLTSNATTLAAIEARLNASLAPNKRVQPGSIRWDPAAGPALPAGGGHAGDYVFTEQPNPPPAAGAPPGTVDRHLPINAGASGDWFALDANHMNVLAERSALWSIQSEVGSGPGADAASGRPDFRIAVRDAIRADRGVAYIRNTILAYLNVTAPHAWLSHGIKGWGPTTRNTFFNATACDLCITLHENAGGGVGGMALIAQPGENPPQDQIRIGKLFLKYVDGFDHGLRQGGVTRELVSNPATMLHSGNHIRDHYYYLESEFMDRVSDAAANRYQIQDMINGSFLATMADQIVSGIVETLLDRQANMDSITLNGGLPLW
jgi:N-acetylmuramoyl-L-alanine amidase